MKKSILLLLLTPSYTILHQPLQAMDNGAGVIPSSEEYSSDEEQGLSTARRLRHSAQSPQPQNGRLTFNEFREALKKAEQIERDAELARELDAHDSQGTDLPFEKKSGNSSYTFTQGVCAGAAVGFLVGVVAARAAEREGSNCTIL